MMLYRPGNGSIREGKELDKTVSEFLGNTSLTRGVLDAHINNVTSEEVFSQPYIKNDITAVHWRSITFGEMVRHTIGSSYR